MAVRLQEEVKEVLGENTEVTEHDLDKLQYTEQVCHESFEFIHFS